MDSSDYEVDRLEVLAPSQTVHFQSPVFQAKGNSLFAELDDHRQVVETKYSSLVSRYDRLSNLYQQLEAERNLLEEQYRSRLTELTVRSAQANALDEIRRQHQACVQECDSLRDQLQRLRNDLAEEKKLRRESEAQISSLKEIMASLSRLSTGDSGDGSFLPINQASTGHSIKNSLFRTSCNRPQCLTQQGHVQQLEKELKKESARAVALERQLWTIQAELNAQRTERGARGIELKQMGIDLEDERSRVKQLLLRLQRIAIESSSVANTGPSDDSASSNPFLAALASIRTISSLSTTERTIIGLGTAAADENSSEPAQNGLDSQKSSVDEPPVPGVCPKSDNHLPIGIFPSESALSEAFSSLSDNPFLIGLRGIFVAPTSASNDEVESNILPAGKSSLPQSEAYRMDGEKTSISEEHSVLTSGTDTDSPAFAIAGAARVNVAEHELDSTISSPPLAAAAQQPPDQVKPKRFLWREKLLLPPTFREQPPFQ